MTHKDYCKKHPKCQHYYPCVHCVHCKRAWKAAMKQAALENKKFMQLYLEIARMTSNHDVENDKAVIYACNLGKALEKIDSEWYRIK